VDIREQCVQVAKHTNGILVYIRNSAASRSRSWSSVLTTAEATPWVLCSVLGPSLQEAHQRAGACPEKGHKAVKGLEHKSDGEWLRERGLCCLENRRLRGNLTALYSCLKGGYSWDEGWPLLPCNSRRMREDGLKLRQGRFKLDISKNFSKREVRCWNRLPREVVESLSLEGLKKCLDAVLRGTG